MSSSNHNQQLLAKELSPKRTYFSTLARAGFTAAAAVGPQISSQRKSISPKNSNNKQPEVESQNHFTYQQMESKGRYRKQEVFAQKKEEKTPENARTQVASLNQQHFTYSAFENQLAKMAGLKCHSQESFGNTLIMPQQKGNDLKPPLTSSSTKPPSDIIQRFNSTNGLPTLEYSQSSSVTLHDLSRLFHEFQQQQSSPKILIQQEATPGLSSSPNMLRNHYFEGIKQKAVAQGQVKEIDDSENLKMFDPLFKQSNEASLAHKENTTSVRSSLQPSSAQSLQPALRDQIVNDSFNKRQKEKARAMLSNLQNQISNEKKSLNTPPSRTRLDQDCSRIPVQDIANSKPDSPKNESSGALQNSSKSSNTMFMARKTSPNSRSQLSRAPTHTYQIEYKTYFEELQKKEVIRQELIAQKELEGFTGKPEINKRSKSIKRKVDDLMEWGEDLKQKREHEQKKRVDQENEELKQLQSMRVINKESERLLEYKKKHLEEKVENRLMRDASRRNNKKKENSIIKSKSATRVRSKSAKTLIKSHKKKKERTVSPLNLKRAIIIGNAQVLVFNNSTENLGYSKRSGSVKSPKSEKRGGNTLSSQSLFSPILSHRSYANRFVPNEDQTKKPKFEGIEKLLSPSFMSNLSQKAQKHPLQQIQNQLLQSQPQSKKQKLEPQLFQAALQKANQINKQNQEQVESQTTKVSSHKTKSKPTKVKKRNNASRHLKKGPIQYESLFDKVSRICNTSNTIEHTESHKSSMSHKMNEQDGTTYQDNNSTFTTSTVPVVSASIPQIFQNYHQSAVLKEQKMNNLVYQSIKQECSQNGQPSNIVGQSLNQNTHKYLLNHSLSPIQMNANQSSTNQSTNMYLGQLTANQTQILSQQNLNLADLQNRSKLHCLQDYNSNDHASFSFNNYSRNQNQENVIIHKILESPYIPSGNINQLRSQKTLNSQLKDDDGLIDLRSNMKQKFTLDDCEKFQRPLTVMAQTVQNPLLAEQQLIMSSQSTNMFNISDKLSKLSSMTPQTEQPQLTEDVKSPQSQECQQVKQEQVQATTGTIPVLYENEVGKRQISSQKHQEFIDRNQKWLEVKQQKLQKVKQIVDSRQSRECPFKPSIVSNAVQTISHKSVERETQTRSRSKSQKKTMSPGTIKKNNKDIIQQEIRAQVQKARDWEQKIANIQPILKDTQKKRLAEEVFKTIEVKKSLAEIRQATPSSSSKRVQFRVKKSGCEVTEKDSFDNFSVNQEFSSSKMDSFMSRASEFSTNNPGNRAIKVIDKKQQVYF